MGPGMRRAVAAVTVAASWGVKKRNGVPDGPRRPGDGGHQRRRDGRPPRTHDVTAARAPLPPTDCGSTLPAGAGPRSARAGRSPARTRRGPGGGHGHESSASTGAQPLDAVPVGRSRPFTGPAEPAVDASWMQWAGPPGTSTPARAGHRSGGERSKVTRPMCICRPPFRMSGAVPHRRARPATGQGVIARTSRRTVVLGGEARPVRAGPGGLGRHRHPPARRLLLIVARMFDWLAGPRSISATSPRR